MKQITIKNNIKKSLITFSFYALALTSCSTIGSDMNIQKGSCNDVSIKNKLVFEASRDYDEAVKTASAALADVDAAWAKVRAAAPEDRAAAMAAVEAAEAEEEAKSAAAAAAFEAVEKASSEATAAYETAYPDRAKARAAALAPALAAAGNNVAARAAVYGKFCDEYHANLTETRTKITAFARDYQQALGSAGNTFANHSEVVHAIQNATEAAGRLVDYGTADVTNAQEASAKAATDDSTRSKTNGSGNVKDKGERFTRS